MSEGTGSGGMGSGGAGSGAPNGRERVELPLYYGYGVAGGAGEPALGMQEAPLRRHLIVRGDPGDPGFLEGVKSVAGVAPPTRPGRWAGGGGTAIYWLGPDEWLLITAASDDTEARFREALGGHFSVVDVSGGQTLLKLRGEGLDVLLQKAGGYDFHPDHFGPGRCVSTVFAKATALVARCRDGSVDLVIRRSFADYLARWLLAAGAEFGCRLEPWRDADGVGPARQPSAAEDGLPGSAESSRI